MIHRQHFFDAAGARSARWTSTRSGPGSASAGRCPGRDLHRVLLSGAGGAVRHGAEVRTLDLLPGAVGVTFTDGTAAEYDLVIGADGPRSTVRALAALGGPRRPVGQVVYRAVVRDGPPVADWTALLGRRSGFLMVPIGAGRLYCYADEAGTEEPADPLARLRELFGRLRRPGAGDAGGDRRGAGRAHRRGGAGPLVPGPVLLVGDAAHATAPTLSQGAAMAFEDAVVLAESLRAAGSVEAALVAYESRRRPRTRWVRDRTRDRNRTRDVPPALRDPMLRGRGRRIFGEHYRLLLGPL